MPPKRKAAAAKGAGGKRGKKAAPEEVEDAPPTVKDVVKALKSADKGRSRTAKVDDHCHLSAAGSVHEDFDCMLNQTNIGHNNNKYYVIQVIQCGAHFYAWNRWGRVGEPGANKLNGPLTKDKAIADFKKKFQDKTRNKWDERDSFKAVPGKYTLLEMDDEEAQEETAAKVAKLDEIDGVKKTVAKCTLNKPTQDLVKLIFDHDMFKEAMANMEIDVKKMPLGKLSKSQIAKGFEVLEEIEEVLKKTKKGNLQELTSRFYTVIPHSFGRQRPPVISDLEHLQKKMDMLMVLGDIEIAQALQQEKKPAATTSEESVPHPFDLNYKSLQCGLDVVDKKSKEFKILQNNLKATNGGHNLEIMEIWKVDRDGEDDRFRVHDKTGNRKLLWHGTNVAVVAAILKSGLRIMPHSGGRVGRGIYFASENSKSAGYVRCANRTGIMFLNEVVLGKENIITRDNSSLKSAPKGYDSVLAKGHQEPDPKDDVVIKIEGKDVVVPQGKPKTLPEYSNSSFWQSEYLVYKESQARIRYLLKLKF